MKKRIATNADLPTRLDAIIVSSRIGYVRIDDTWYQLDHGWVYRAAYVQGCLTVADPLDCLNTHGKPASPIAERVITLYREAYSRVVGA